jgi:hypothetical protein
MFPDHVPTLAGPVPAEQLTHHGAGNVHVDRPERAAVRDDRILHPPRAFLPLPPLTMPPRYASTPTPRSSSPRHPHSDLHPVTHTQIYTPSPRSTPTPSNPHPHPYPLLAHRNPLPHSISIAIYILTHTGTCTAPTRKLWLQPLP